MNGKTDHHFVDSNKMVDIGSEEGLEMKKEKMKSKASRQPKKDLLAQIASLERRLKQKESRVYMFPARLLSHSERKFPTPGIIPSTVRLRVNA